jgi:general secretion pathway protein C
MRDGKVIGVRVMGIDAESLPALLGLANGDRLERVNGIDLSSPENALMAYAKLRNTSRLDLDVERRGQKVTITYFIR